MPENKQNTIAVLCKGFAFVLLIMVFFSELKAQIPNGNFEQWQTTHNYFIETWDSYGIVLPESSAISGQKSIRIVYDSIQMNTSFILMGQYDNSLGFIGGMPYNARPDSIKGFFKCYSPFPGDQGLLHVVFKKNGSPLSSDYFAIPLSADTSQFEAHAFKINYNHPSLIPDSVIILLTHPNPFQSNQYGGFIIADNLHFINSPLPIPNGDFENWLTQSYDTPLNWLNYNDFAHHHATYPIQKSTTALSGQFAVKIQNSLGILDTIPGVIVYSETYQWGSGAMPLHERFTSFKGFYTYQPQHGDTMNVFLLLYHADSVIGFAEYYSNQPTPVYTAFDVPIYYSNAFLGVPDSATIYIAAYKSKPRGNSVLLIDELSLVNNTDILINEFVSANSNTNYDHFGSAEDWIEIFNAGNSPVYLSNFMLSDDSLYIDKWRFPHYTLAPDSFFLVFASGKNIYYPEAHSNFSISVTGEPLILSTTAGHICDYLPPLALTANVSYGRYPDGQSNLVYFKQPTPRQPNNTMYYSGISTVKPQFSVSGGFYTDSLFLNITTNHPTATIRYTNNGAIPQLTDSIFCGPLLLKSRIGDTNTISSISETSLFYAPPLGEVDKAHVIRARLFMPDSINTEVETHTFFIDNQIFNTYNTPVISLATDSLNLFDYNTGIYVLGKTYYDWLQQNPNDSTTNMKPANYFKRGDLWERPMHIEYYEADGQMGFKKNVGARIHGGASRMWPQKSLRLYTRGVYDSGKINYPLFDNLKKRGNNDSLTSFDNIVLRNSGNDFGVTFFRDAFMHTLINHTKVDFLAFKPAIVFLNGEFWGYQNIRERNDAKYINAHYNVPEEDIVILSYYGAIENGVQNDNLHYYKLLNYVQNNDMFLSVHYDSVKKMMDVENYALYQAIQIFYRNTDWPGNNIKFWRKRTSTYEPQTPYGHDGRWRWMLYDLDFGFGFQDGYNAPSHNTLSFAMQAGIHHWPNPNWSTILFRYILNNHDFKHMFMNTMADQINTSFRSHRVLNIIDSLQSIYTPNMQKHIDRYGLSLTLNSWNENVNIMRFFATMRPQYVFQHIVDTWYIGGTYNITLDVSNVLHGEVRINSIHINGDTKGINLVPYPWDGVYFKWVPIQIEALPKPGYNFIEWEGTGISTPLLDVAYYNDTTLKAVFALDTTYAHVQVFINEFMASNNTTISDAYGEYDDWIELYNNSTDTIDIGGFFITDNLDMPTKHRFPEGFSETLIPPMGFILIWADGTPEQGPLHTNFKLSATGEAIGLFAPDSITVIDTLSFGQQITDISFGRYPDGASQIVLFNEPTPGTSNIINSVESVYQTPSFMAFPNPSNEPLLMLNGTYHVKVYESTGKIIYENESCKQINTSLWARGIYFIQNESGAFLKFVKF